MPKELHASIMILGACMMKLGAFIIKLYQLRQRDVRAERVVMALCVCMRNTDVHSLAAGSLM